MMRRPPAPLASILALTVAACGSPEGPVPAARRNATAHLAAPYLVLLSLDGFRHDYLDRYPTPALQRLAAQGVRAERMIPVFPTKTFPAHYTVATGMYAERHGLVGNRFWAPERGALYDTGDRAVVEDGSWYRGEPIWVTAERQGMRSASFFFVGTEADVGGVRPTYWRRYDEGVANAARVDTALAWLGLPPERRPHLVTLYFSDLDDAGHRHGPDSPQVRSAVAAVDAALGRLMDGLDRLPHGDRVTLVVVSDHGMLRADADRVQPVDMSRFPGVRMVEGGPYASFVVDEGGPGRAAAVRDSLRSLLPEANVWLRAEVPARFHYSADPRIGDVVALAAPGAMVVPAGRGPDGDTWQHGWDNLVPEMGAIFLARGPGIAAGRRVPAFESVDVYPFLARVLGLTPNPGVDGRAEVLAGVLSGAR